MVFPDILMGPQWSQGGMNQAGFAMAVAASTVIFTMVQQFLFKHLMGYIERTIRKLINSADPFVHIKFTDYTNDGGPKNDQAYKAIETYLSAKCAANATRLKANVAKDIRTVVLCLDGGEVVQDEFKGVKERLWSPIHQISSCHIFFPSEESIRSHQGIQGIWLRKSHRTTASPSIIYCRPIWIQVSWEMVEEKEKGDAYHGRAKSKFYILTFHKTNRELVVEEYLKHVMDQGKATAAMNKHLKLYSNNSSDKGMPSWNYIMDLDHPATFDTLAIPEEKKKEIIDDLMRFTNGREYYRQIGKPWKRGYLLHGPPGTGKSTMIAAMANLLKYDVYDLELTGVMSNAALKKLLIRMPGNSILVIEDIDCSSKITVHREMRQDEENKLIERVTLSGLLNCLDGIFSANEGGRLMVFTTNHVENLDQALTRRGRMDKHIEMSYCRFEAFKIMAKNYLGITEHELFPEIQKLLQEVDITPADVAENLIKKEPGEGSEVACFRTLIEVLEKKKEEEKSRGSEADEKHEAEPEIEEAASENGTHVKENGHLD